jgi:hypothetical protein
MVTNGDRAMVALLDESGDPGEHMVDPGASGMATGFMLDNGQIDEYANADTVPLEQALVCIAALVAGASDTSTIWQSDR